MSEIESSKFEQQRITRRQALKKIGVTSAMATFAMFSVDELARMVGKELKTRAGSNELANRVADEFRSTGIVLADPPGGGRPGGCASGHPTAECCTADAVGTWCDGYHNQSDCHKCVNGVYGSDGFCKDFVTSGLQGNKSIAYNSCLWY